MAYKGAPTLVCALLLLSLAALYASVSSTKDVEFKVQDDVHRDLDQNQQLNLVRVARASSRSRTRVNTNRGTNERAGDGETQRTPSPNSDVTRTSGRRGGRPNQRRPETGGRRPRPGGNRDGLPPGINRKMMKLAEKIHQASTPFAVRLLNAVAPSLTRDIVLSPLSVHAALSMTMLGAKGRTEREMSNVLGLRLAKLRKKKPHKGYRALLSSLQTAQTHLTIYTANAVFVKQNIPLEESFRQGLTQMYNATFDSFQLGHPQGPESPINSWVSNVTHNKISQLLAPGSITPLTALVLINAIYLKAGWSSPFPSSLTRRGQFTDLNGVVQTVDMMSSVAFRGYVYHHNTQVIELLYSGDRLAMYILLPTPASNITQLQQHLVSTEQQGSSPLDQMLDTLQERHLELYLPKFKIESNVLELKGPLQNMSMVRVFNHAQADFKGISSSGGLYISSVLHKAVIEVNESGTEAAAATSVGVMQLSMPHEVRVDRPFIFVIRDKTLKEILFMGAYVGHRGTSN